jgi:uncharacterized protein (DUF2141 family)
MKLFFLIFFAFFNSKNIATEIPVKITGIKSGEGQILVSVFEDSKFFLEDKGMVWKEKFVLKKNQNELIIRIPISKTEKMGIAVFQDVNSNGKLDKHFLGYPIEPYGFSGKVSSKLRSPKWEEVSFDVKSTVEKLSKNKEVLLIKM